MLQSGYVGVTADDNFRNVRRPAHRRPGELGQGSMAVLYLTDDLKHEGSRR
jgi:hypothetical protein